MELFELSSQKPFVPSVRRGVILIIEYQSVCSFVLIGSLALSPASKCVPPDPKGGGHTRLRAGEGSGSQFGIGRLERKLGTLSTPDDIRRLVDVYE